jgi:glycosyltransferase involved in cell wall biosynthesis
MPMVFPYSLSVFFSAYNDARSLPMLVGATFEVLERYVADYEVIVVNDGSQDDTGEVLERLTRRFGARLRVVTHARNRGYGGALRSGFEAATKEFVFYTDGDGQYDVRELPKLLEMAWPDTGLVNGFKTRRQDPWHRVAIGFIYNKFARLLFRVRLRDIDCDYRLVRRSLLHRSPLRCTSGTVCVELVKKLESSGMRVAEVPVSHFPRRYGHSQFFRISSLGATFVQLCALYVRFVAMRGLR